MASNENTDDDSLLWTAVATVVSLGAATMVRKVLEKGWVKQRGFVPGKGDADQQASWVEAAVFATVSGVAVGMIRMVADRTIQKARAQTA